MKEELSHCRLIGVFNAAIESVVRRLESHLHKRVRRKSHGSNEVFAISRKIKCLKLILLDQVGQSGLCETKRNVELRNHVPLQFVGSCAHIPKAFWISL